MKRILFSVFTLAVIAGFTFAQNAAYIEQVSNSAGVNLNDIVQKQSALNLMKVNQATTVGNNLLYGPSDAFENHTLTSYAYQNGTGNKIYGAYENANYAAGYEPYFAKQTAGTGNTMEVYQGGDDNMVGLTQSTSGNNKAEIFQNNGSNELYAYQAETVITNDLKVEQTGGDNSCTLLQKAANRNIADLQQEGGGNSAKIHQDTGVNYNKVTLDQTGGDIAEIFQRCLGAATGSYNLSTVKQ